MTPAEDERRRARRFGWTALVAWACLGLALETMHGLKVSAYLDDPVVRLVLTLAHAHGVGLALVVLVHSVAGVPLREDAPDGGRRAGGLLRAGAVLVPVGFALSALGHAESDPGPAIWIVPPGALCVIAGLAHLALAAWRRR